MQKRVSLNNISKHFGGVYALQNVSLDLYEGEVLGLVGENGAGKSTLMKILSGAYTLDGGTIEVEGAEVSIKNPADGRKYGVGIIYQEFALANHLTIAENIFLHSISDKFWVNWGELNNKAAEIIEKLGFNLDPKKLVGEISVAHKQVVEIAKALSEKVKILVLDEPTTVLAPAEVQRLHEIIANLNKEGISVVYVSHRLEEIFSITDRVAVLKDGELVGVKKTSELNMDQLINMMIGRSLSAVFPPKNQPSDEIVFEAKNLSKENVFKNINFQVRKGEVFGFSGLVGSGRSETMRAIFGADGGYDEGEIYLRGRKIFNNSIAQGVKNGFGFIPEDRKEEGIILHETVRNNISFTIINELTNILRIIQRKKETTICDEQVSSLNIKTPSIDTDVYYLSGGNQQKVVLAKWFAKDTELIIFDEPARGVDVGAKVEIYSLINQLAENGVGVIVISSELMEIMGLCNRTAVMCEGEIAGILDSDEITEERIMVLSIKGGSRNGA